MRTIKRNQVMIGVIAVLLMTVGYFNYNGNIEADKAIETGTFMDAEKYASIGDATLVSSGAVETENTTVPETNTMEETLAAEEDPITTSSKNVITEYFNQSRLERDTMYSQSVSTYQKLLENSSISSDQKQIAQEEIKRIQDEKNAIMITENLIKTKGIEDVIIFKNKESVNVIIKSEEPSEEEIAQIQNIVTREMQVELENMHISAKN